MRNYAEKLRKSYGKATAQREKLRKSYGKPTENPPPQKRKTYGKATENLRHKLTMWKSYGKATAQAGIAEKLRKVFPLGTRL